MQREFVERGYVILRQAVQTDAASREMAQHFPPDASDPVQDFGSGNGALFPSTPALNAIAVHPVLLRAVRQILGHNIRLKQSVPWAKYGVPCSGPKSNSDQRVHMDYGNNQWDMPTPGHPVAVAAIVYYSHTAATGGGTAVVPRQGPDDPVYHWPYTHMPGISGNPFVNRRAEAEAIMSETSAALRAQCYAREVTPQFEPGDVLLYGLDTWHRGTPVHAGHVRYAHNLLWAQDDADVQQWNPGFTSALYGGAFERFIGRLEPAQLQTLGFPAPTDARWETPSFVQAMRARYGWAGFDVMRYVHAAQRPPPPVPPNWFWASGRLQTRENPTTYRAKLWRICAAQGLHIEMVSAQWFYTLETAEPYYARAECHFFRDGDRLWVDMHGVDGDRWTWAHLMRNIEAMLQDRTPRRLVRRGTPVPADASLEGLISPDMSEEFFDMFGPDVRPDPLLDALADAPINTRRCLLRALYHCETPFETALVAPYARTRPQTFLERQAQSWAKKILVKGKHLAHL